MILIFNKLTKLFEDCILTYLKINNKLEEFNKVRENILVTSTKEEFGDFQSNVSLILSKICKKNPKFIASEILKLIKANDDITNMVEELEIAGPGFINVKLKKNIFINQLIINYKSDRLNVPKIEKGKKIIIDFSSPNIAKEMHVGHLRSTIIGDSLAKIFEFRGFSVLRINHVGDWGTQFGMLISHLKDVYPDALKNTENINLGDLVEFYKASKKRFDNDINFQEKARQEVIKLQQGNAESISAWKLICNQSRKEFNNIYNILNIEIEERGESFYNKYLKNIVQELESKNIIVEDQKAKCVFLEGMKNKEGKPLPLIIQKKDGGFNYATTDLAALKYRFNKAPNGDGAYRIIYVTDQGQSNHFSAVFQVAEKAQWIPKNCQVTHVPFGLVQGVDGKKLKTREGETIRLKDLLNESIKRAENDLKLRLEKENRKEDKDFIEKTSKIIGISAVKYADLSQNRITNYQFSFDKMLALNGNTAPYLLYTVVRIAGIKRKNNFKEDEINLDKILFNEIQEWRLIKKLLKFDEIIISAENELMPNRICNYLYEICQIFNRFYDQLSILKAEQNIKQSRLLLCYLTEKTLKLSLNILGIETLERM